MYEADRTPQRNPKRPRTREKTYIHETIVSFEVLLSELHNVFFVRIIAVHTGKSIREVSGLREGKCSAFGPMGSRNAERFSGYSGTVVSRSQCVPNPKDSRLRPHRQSVRVPCLGRGAFAGGRCRE